MSTIDISYKQTKIEVVDTIKYLGIYLDNKLHFKHHICMLETKLSRLLGMLYKTCIKKVYYAFIHSHLTSVCFYGELLQKQIYRNYSGFRIKLFVYLLGIIGKIMHLLN